MLRLLSVLTAVALHMTAAPAPVALIPVEGEGAAYWPRWRGPSGQGHVAGTNYVDNWSHTQNVRWRVQVPGRGHSSPIVWKDHIFLTTARDGGSKLSMLAYRRSNGALLWEKDVPTSGVERAYRKNSHASATPVTDGQRVYASFGTHGLAAFDFNGALVWHRKLGDLRNYHGSAGSPVLYKDRIFIYQDHGGSSTLGSFVAAFNARTGDVIWKTDRQASVGWGTPVVVNTGTRDELIVNGQYQVHAYDPNSGAELWRVNGTTMEVIPTAVVVGDQLFFTNDNGQTFVVQAGRTFKLLRVNELNAQVLASPALVDGAWYWRTDQELIAIGGR